MTASGPASSLAVVLDDAEQRAHLLEAEGRLASTRARLEKPTRPLTAPSACAKAASKASKILEDDARVEVAALREP